MSSRIVIAGVPRSGKTTFARALAADTGLPVLHTDDLIDKYEWSALSQHVASTWMASGHWIIEGVATPRSLRKRLDAYPLSPCDVVYWATSPKISLTKAQATMAKGCARIFSEIESELRKRGVVIRSL